VEARRLLSLAAAQGNADAQYTLGIMHQAGSGGPQDEVEARRLLSLAAAQGNADAQCYLGLMHQAGSGGPQDEVEARRLFSLLFSLRAAQGHTEAKALGKEEARRVTKALELKQRREERAAQVYVHHPAHYSLLNLTSQSFH
jgi:TPR repeat protein